MKARSCVFSSLDAFGLTEDMRLLQVRNCLALQVAPKAAPPEVEPHSLATEETKVSLYAQLSLPNMNCCDFQVSLDFFHPQEADKRPVKPIMMHFCSPG